MDNFLEMINLFFNTMNEDKTKRYFISKNEIVFSHSACSIYGLKELKFKSDDINVISLLTSESKEEFINLKNKFLNYVFNIASIRLSIERSNKFMEMLPDTVIDNNEDTKDSLNIVFNKILDLISDNFYKIEPFTSVVLFSQINSLTERINHTIAFSKCITIEFSFDCEEDSNYIIKFILGENCYMEISSKEYIDVKNQLIHFLENPYEYDLNYITFYSKDNNKYDSYPISYAMLKEIKNFIIPRINNYLRNTGYK